MSNVNFAAVDNDGVVVVSGELPEDPRSDMDFLAQLYNHKEDTKGVKYFSVNGEQFAVVPNSLSKDVATKPFTTRAVRGKGAAKPVKATVGIAEETRKFELKLANKHYAMLTRAIADLDEEIASLVAEKKGHITQLDALMEKYPELSQSAIESDAAQ